LLNNAIKFTDKGFIEFGYSTNNEGRLEFYVKDTGIGINEEEQKLIFDRFKHVEETIAKKFSGSGLGLTISKSLVKLLGGRIWVESEFDKGSTFYFTLPFENVPEKIDSLESEELVIENYNWKDKVILVVEDEEVNYMFLESVLHDTQAQVLHASTGDQAIELVKSIHKIDLILMDIKMPEKDGYENN
jgi:hypothetical protein